MSWRLSREIIIGGLTHVGIDPSSRYLLVISASGRGLFSLAQGTPLARDYSKAFEAWLRPDTKQAEGIGECRGIWFEVSGPEDDLRPEVRRVLEKELLISYVDDREEVRGAVLSPDGQWLVVAGDGEIEIYRRDESRSPGCLTLLFPGLALLPGTGPASWGKPNVTDQ